MPCAVKFSFKTGLQRSLSIDQSYRLLSLLTTTDFQASIGDHIFPNLNSLCQKVSITSQSITDTVCRPD
jgi:hypothetical protein